MIERSLAFGDNGRLVGTLCLPSVPAEGVAGVGQILFNAGVVHRVGPHRINVRLARRLALRGIPSIRFDLSGQGDSGRPSGTLSFEEQSVADIRAAMDVLGTAAQVDRFALFGFCSGGWHSYAAAPADKRVAGILLYDTFFYLTMRSRVIRRISAMRQRGILRAVGRWAARQPTVIFRSVRRLYIAESEGGPSPNPGLAMAPPKAEFAAMLRKLHERGTKIAVMYSGGFQEYTYRDQFHDAFRAFGIRDILHFDYFPDMGHTAMELAAQSEFMGRIEEWTASLDDKCRKDAAAAV